VQKYWYRLKNRQMYRKTNIHTYIPYIPTVLYIRQTNRETDCPASSGKEKTKCG
jgi:hypothetical protein